MGEQVVEMVRGKAALKLWAAPRLGTEGRPVEDRRLVDVEVDGWVLGPLHVADYDPMSTLQAMSSVGTAPPGWGAVSLYGQSIGLRQRAGGTREQLVEEGRRAAMVMWEHVLRHVVARVGRDEAAVVEALRQVVRWRGQSPETGLTLGEVMVELAAAVVDEVAGLDRLNETRLAHKAAVQAQEAAKARVNTADLLIRLALGLPAGAEAVPDVG